MHDKHLIKVKMEDALEALIDYRGKTPKKSSCGLSTLSAKSVKNGFIDYSQCYFISKDEYKKFMVRGFPQKGDILLTTEAPLGVVAKLDRNDVAVAQRLLTLRGKKGLLDNDYLLYYLQSSAGQAALKARESGTTVTGIKQAEFRKIELVLPSIDTQKRIASILSSLDGKIKNSTQINHNLEEQAKAIFKSWFVDFEPFQNGKFVDSELGKIPEGWQVRDVYAISSVIYGAPFASKLFTTEKQGKPIVRIRDLSTETPQVYTTECHPKGYVLQPGDIVVGMDGEFKAYLWGGVEAWLNQRVCVFKPHKGYSSGFVRFSIMPLLAAVEASEVATTVIHLGKNDIDKFRVIIPDSKVLAAFNEIAAPISAKIVQNKIANRRLAQLRDILLPKLMSGEIDVSEVEV